MTLKQFLQSETIQLFAPDTRIHFMSSEGCQMYKSDFNNRVNLNNALSSFNDDTLNREISFIDVARINFLYGAIIIYFKD